MQWAAPRKRGRPPEADRSYVSRVALRLFERRGFEQVTMEEIAEAASVSRRTLFRLFPSKADLVWDGLDEVRLTLQARAAEPVASAPGLDALLHELLTASLGQLRAPALARLARRRLALIARSPALLGHHTLQELQEVITALVARSSGPGDAPPALVARTLVAVGFGAVLWWAEEGASLGPEAALRAALATLSRAARPV